MHQGFHFAQLFYSDFEKMINKTKAKKSAAAWNQMDLRADFSSKMFIMNLHKVKATFIQKFVQGSLGKSSVQNQWEIVFKRRDFEPTMYLMCVGERPCTNK